MSYAYSNSDFFQFGPRGTNYPYALMTYASPMSPTWLNRYYHWNPLVPDCHDLAAYQDPRHLAHLGCTVGGLHCLMPHNGSADSPVPYAQCMAWADWRTRLVPGGLHSPEGRRWMQRLRCLSEPKSGCREYGWKCR